MVHASKWWKMGSHAGGSCSVMEREKQAIDELTDKASEVIHRFAESAKELNQQAQQGVDAVKDAASDFADQGRQRVMAMGKHVGAHVQEHPAAAVLLAVGAGLALGALMRMAKCSCASAECKES